MVCALNILINYILSNLLHLKLYSAVYYSKYNVNKILSTLIDLV